MNDFYIEILAVRFILNKFFFWKNRKFSTSGLIRVCIIMSFTVNSKLEPKNGKGEVQVITWKGITIGEYAGHGLLGHTLEKFRKGRFDFGQIKRLLDKASSVKSLQLYNELLNLCSCREIDMSSRDFTGHCLDHHRGISPKDSQLNKAP